MTCKRHGCEKSIRYARWEYCSDACERYVRRKAMRAITGGGPAPIPPEDVPERTPSEMQEAIDDVLEKVKV